MLKYKLNINDIRTYNKEIKCSYYNISEHSTLYNKNIIFCYHNGEISLNKDDKILMIKRIFYNQDGEAIINDINEKTNIISVDSSENLFSCYIDKYFKLEVKSIEYNELNDEYIVLFNGNHFFDANDSIELFLYNGIFNPISDCVYKNENELIIKKPNDAIKDIINENKDGYIQIYRRNFTKNIYFYKIKDSTGITLQLSSSSDIDLAKNEEINDFVKSEIEESITPIIEMEKQPYSPVIFKNNNDFSDANKIKINLHFRQHRGDNWQCDVDSLWNGIDTNTNKFIEDYFVLSDKSNQSDLIYYADFTDLDIRYQKNKVKKSFLRFTFYDSNNPSNQSLLAYSTVFINSGKLFSKYTKNIYNEPYKKVREKEVYVNGKKKIEYIIEKNLVGIRNDREPDGNLIGYEEKINTVGNEDTTEENKKIVKYEDDIIEKYRLSTQFIIEDKFKSKSSSEGFYIYLWKDYNEVMPKDLYMKIDYNNAEYGRTIPFMMPFKINKSTKGIKKFEDILDDWTIGNGYSISEYKEYSYIKLKYKYDSINDKHIYYLDNDLYGDDVYDKDGNNEIVLNLYEAKIR